MIKNKMLFFIGLLMLLFELLVLGIFSLGYLFPVGISESSANFFVFTIFGVGIFLGSIFLMVLGLFIE